jgi:hypothetical protein
MFLSSIKVQFPDEKKEKKFLFLATTHEYCEFKKEKETLVSSLDSRI